MKPFFAYIVRIHGFGLSVEQSLHESSLVYMSWCETISYGRKSFCFESLDGTVQQIMHFLGVYCAE